MRYQLRYVRNARLRKHLQKDSPSSRRRTKPALRQRGLLGSGPWLRSSLRWPSWASSSACAVRLDGSTTCAGEPPRSRFEWPRRRRLVTTPEPPRDVGLEPWLANLLPEVLLGLGPQEFAAIAEAAFAPRPPDPGVSIAHVHAPPVSVREQAAILVERLRRRGVASFRSLTEDADSTLVVVGRFLALLEDDNAGRPDYEVRHDFVGCVARR